MKMRRIGLLTSALFIVGVIGISVVMAQNIHGEATVTPSTTNASAEADLEWVGDCMKQEIQSSDEKTIEKTNKSEKDSGDPKDKVRKDGKATGAAISHLLDRCKELIKHEVERSFTGWRILLAGSMTKADLIEAKLHLHHAETYQFSTLDFDKAKAEMDCVEAYLKDAADYADLETSVKIESLEKIIQQIKANLSSASKVARERYAEAKGLLNQLIRDL